MQFQLFAFDRQRHRLAGGLRREADAAQAVDAVALARHDAAGVPAARIAALAVESAVAKKWMAGQRVSRAAGAEFGLKILAHLVGPVVGRGVRIAVLQNMQRHVFRRMRELFEEWNQRSGAFQSADGLGGSFADGAQGRAPDRGRNMTPRAHEHASCATVFLIDLFCAGGHRAARRAASEATATSRLPH